MNNEPLVLSGHRFDIGIRIEPQRQTNGRVRAQRPPARYAKASAKRLNESRTRSGCFKKCIVINRLIPACRGRAGQQPVPGREWACGALEEAGDRRPEAVHIDQERIVSLNRGQAFELQVPHAALQYGGQFFLLMQRKQEI